MWSPNQGHAFCSAGVWDHACCFVPVQMVMQIVSLDQQLYYVRVLHLWGAWPGNALVYKLA